MLTMLGAVAEFERTLMLERQREGIAKAKADGQFKGRKPTARAKAAEIRRLRAEGVMPTAIAGGSASADRRSTGCWTRASNRKGAAAGMPTIEPRSPARPGRGPTGTPCSPHRRCGGVQRTGDAAITAAAS